MSLAREMAAKVRNELGETTHASDIHGFALCGKFGVPKAFVVDPAKVKVECEKCLGDLASRLAPVDLGPTPTREELDTATDLTGSIKLPTEVDHPAHYTAHPSGVECIEITRHFDFCTGNAIKYLWRAGLKGGEAKRLEDLYKARKYVDFLIADAKAGK